MGQVLEFTSAANPRRLREDEIKRLRDKIRADTIDGMKDRAETQALNYVRAGGPEAYEQLAHSDQELLRGEIAAEMLECAAFELRFIAVLHDGELRKRYMPTTKQRVTEAAKRGATSIALRAAIDMFPIAIREELVDLSEDKPDISPEDQQEINKRLWAASVLTTAGNDLLQELLNKYPFLVESEDVLKVYNLPPTT